VGPTGGKGLKFQEDSFEHAVNIRCNVAVAKSQSCITQFRHRRVTPEILSGIMCISVDLDDQASTRTKEIGDYAGADDVLAAKFEPT
jgi:hypothetical protein